MAQFDKQYGYAIDMRGVEGIITVDSTNDITMFCMRTAFAGCRIHFGTEQAISNLLAGMSTNSVNPQSSGNNRTIIGHGNDGFIVTGGGQNPDTSNPNSYLGLRLGNPSFWAPIVSRLQGAYLETLCLLGCHVGTGDDGADLLYAIAQATNHNVAGPTGFVYCGPGVWFEKGAVWQVATPTNRPTPIAAPSAHFNMDQELFTVIEPSGEQRIPLDRVTSVTYHRTVFQGRDSGSTLSREEAQNLLRSIDFAAPFTPGGSPLAMITGILTVTYVDDANNEKAREFRVYNDRLLEDPASPSTFYRAGPAFKQSVEKLGRE